MSVGFDEATLRALVRRALLEAMPTSASPKTGLAGRGGPATGQTLHVRVGDDSELAALVRQVLQLADDPVQGPALRAGRTRFTLHPGPRGSGEPRSRGVTHDGFVGPGTVICDPSRGTGTGTGTGVGAGPARVVVAGPVLERHVRAAAENGTALVAASRGLVTPLARELARSRGVRIVVEPTTRRRDR